MKIRHEGTEKVTYTQWGERLSGFMLDANRVTSNNHPENKDGFPRIDIDITKIIDGFDAKVRYYQVTNPNDDLTQEQIDAILAQELVKANAPNVSINTQSVFRNEQSVILNEQNIILNEQNAIINEESRITNEENPDDEPIELIPFIQVIEPIAILDLLSLDQMVLPEVALKARLIFSYPYKASLESTQAMLTAASVHPAVENLTGLDLVRGLMQVMTMADILENDVFGLTENQWIQSVI